MIKNEIKKFYLRHHEDQELTLRKEEVKEFDNNGCCIKIYEDDSPLFGTDIRPTETTLKYDNHNNLINKITWTPLGYFNEEEYENKYDKNRNLISYEMKYSSGSIGDIKYGNLTKGTFKYDDENRLIKSKIVSHNKKKYGEEESIKIIYDNSGDIIKKDKIEITNIQKPEQYRFRQEKYSFYYNDVGQRLNEINIYKKNKIDGDLLLDSKVIISKDEKLIYDNNELDVRVKFSYDYKERIQKEEWFYDPFTYNRILYEYEYVEY